MFRTLALLCIVTVGVSVSALWEKGLKVRFDINPLGIGRTSFMPMPQSITEASDSGWEAVTRPEGPPGYEPLVMWCPKNDYTLCMLYDDTGYIAGLQIAFEKSKFTNVFDMDIQGFTSWSITVNGTAKDFYTIQQYYISTETLATDAATRKAARNPKLLLQDGNLFVSGFNGTIFNISTTVKDFTTGSPYTKQACLPWMGLHYYYNMTKNTPCEDDTLFPWFPLVDHNQLIGVGFVVFGQYAVDSGAKNYFENPGKLAVQVIVPRGPDCLYRLAGNPGLVTMHTYFIKDPYYVTCL